MEWVGDEAEWDGESWEFQSSRNYLTLKTKSGVVKHKTSETIKNY